MFGLMHVSIQYKYSSGYDIVPYVVYTHTQQLIQRKGPERTEGIVLTSTSVFSTKILVESV